MWVRNHQHAHYVFNDYSFPLHGCECAIVQHVHYILTIFLSAPSVRGAVHCRHRSGAGVAIGRGVIR